MTGESDADGLPRQGYLLDTHVLLWWMAEPEALSPLARDRIGTAANAIHISAASLWEITIKQRTGRLRGLADYLDRWRHWHRVWGFRDLPISPTHAVLAGSLPVDHRDPIDRLLIVQSRSEGLPLITDNATIRSLHQDCLW